MSNRYSAGGRRASSSGPRKRIKWFVPSILLVIAVLAAGGLWLAHEAREEAELQNISGDRVNVGTGYRDITYKGKQYRYNTRITSILYAGVDSDGEMVENSRFTDAPRADSVSLIVMDEFHHKLTVIALNRNTVAKIHKFTLNGRDRGKFNDLLCYAYTYGEGGEVSCRNLCDAVSGMLYGIPVNEYVVSNRSSLPVFGEIIGPVEVTVPNDDLAEIAPAFTSGAHVTIDQSNLETFVRSRDIEVTFSNIGRMERQQAYINAAMVKIKSLLENDPQEIWRRVQEATPWMQTNITPSRYLDLIKALKNISYSDRDYYIPAGEAVMGKVTSRFYADEEALLAKVIEIFYIEK